MRLRHVVLLSFLLLTCLVINQSWAQQPKPGGTLRLATPGDLTFFNANQGPAPGYITLWVANNIFGYPFYNQAYFFLESTWLDK